MATGTIKSFHAKPERIGHVISRQALSGEFEGMLRLRVGNHRVLFEETEDTITLFRIRDRREAYR